MYLPVEMLVEVAIWMDEPGNLLGSCYTMLRQIDRFNRHPYRWAAATQDAVDNDDPSMLEWHVDYIKDNIGALDFVITNCMLSPNADRIIQKLYDLYGGDAFMCVTTLNKAMLIDLGAQVVDGDNSVAMVIQAAHVRLMLTCDIANASDKPVVLIPYRTAVIAYGLSIVRGDSGWTMYKKTLEADGI
jgi:hypothetical protein